MSPFDADICLSIEVFDTDGVAANSNLVEFGTGSGIVFDAGSEMRYGRALFGSAVGSELIELALPLVTQYFAGTKIGYVANVADHCSTAIPLSLGPYAGSLGPGETCVLDNGSPGTSTQSCAAPAPPADQYRDPPLAGDFNLTLAAPGSGNDGSVTVTGDTPSWLEFDWDQSVPGLEDPSGTATFGIFSGNPRRIYTREVY